MAGAERNGGPVFGRPAPVMLVALEKAVSALAALAGAVLALVLHVRRRTDPLGLLFPGEVAEAPRDITMRWLVHHVPHVGVQAMLWLGVGLIFWAGLLGAEAIGVWYDLAWGEFLIIVETASFLPIEIYDLVRRHHGHTGFITLVLNLLILGYVGTLYRRRLQRRAAGESLAKIAFAGRPTGGAYGIHAPGGSPGALTVAQRAVAATSESRDSEGRRHVARQRGTEEPRSVARERDAGGGA